MEAESIGSGESPNYYYYLDNFKFLNCKSIGFVLLYFCWAVLDPIGFHWVLQFFFILAFYWIWASAM
jgi:hypothetical protein